MKRLLHLHCVIVAALVLCSATAQAAWQNGAEIVPVSIEKQEQANARTIAADISGDGRFVAFQTNATNLFSSDDPNPPGYTRLGGIFRRDLVTGALELVADGTLVSTVGLPAIPGAQNPSINGDGRFVAFQTFQALVPADVNSRRDVYVRDMDVPIRSPGAFELVSAKDGGDIPASYGGSLGSEAPAGAAISADGTGVLFRTLDASNLPARDLVDTGPGQLFVRDRVTKATTLVTLTRDAGLPAGGAGQAAALSSDGTTVVWAGSNSLSQTRFLAGENASDSEPFWLWRRIADGPSSPTRRITGQVDLDDPDCPAGADYVVDPTALGPCYGPLAGPEGVNFSNITDKQPAISANGRSVAFLTASTPRPTILGRFFDVFVADMTDGITRKRGTIELTRDPSGDDQATSTSIERIDMSADGRWVALTTTRIQFPLLASPVLIGPPPLTVGEFEIYAVDLQTMEMERAVRARSGAEVNGSAESVSLSADGSALAFISSATNLFPGDLNGFNDAFVATRAPGGEEGQDAAETVAALGETRSGTARVKKRLALAVTRLRGGRLRMRVRVPEAGTLRVRATASVPARKRRRARRSFTRTLARASARPGSAGTETVLLRLSRKYLARMTAVTRQQLRIRLLVNFAPSASGDSLRLTRLIRVKQ